MIWMGCGCVKLLTVGVTVSFVLIKVCLYMSNCNQSENSCIGQSAPQEKKVSSSLGFLSF